MDISRFEKISDTEWRIAPFGAMRAPGIIYATESLLVEMDNKIELEEKLAIGVRQPGSAFYLAPQNNQLLPERGILSFQPALGLERRSQDGQHKKDQRDNAARIADSVSSSMRTSFSVPTGARRHRWLYK